MRKTRPVGGLIFISHVWIWTRSPFVTNEFSIHARSATAGASGHRALAESEGTFTTSQIIQYAKRIIPRHHVWRIDEEFVRTTIVHLFNYLLIYPSHQHEIMYGVTLITSICTNRITKFWIYLITFNKLSLNVNYFIS